MKDSGCGQTRSGERFITYLIKGQKDTGVVGVNGAAAHKAKVGNELIIASYVVLEEEKIGFFFAQDYPGG